MIIGRLYIIHKILLIECFQYIKGCCKTQEYTKFVIAASESQSREVRIIKGIAGQARNDGELVIGLYVLQGLFCYSPINMWFLFTIIRKLFANP